MTDTSTPAPTSNRRLDTLGLRFPKLALGVSLGVMFRSIGDAFSMVYVAPYASRQRRPQVAPDDAAGGRDPSW